MPAGEFIFCEREGIELARRLLISLAFAAWCFADTWVEYAEGNVAYFARLDPLRAVVFPILGLAAVLALILFAGWEICRRTSLRSAPAAHFVFLALCLAPAGIGAVAIARALPSSLAPLIRTRWALLVAVLAVAWPLVWTCRRPLRASHLARTSLWYSWPVLILIFAGAARRSLLFPHAAYADAALAAPLPSSPGHPRVVWIIFDELSQTIAFGNRPPSLALPNLDRFKDESFYSTSASSPADQTQISLPSLILGQHVLQAFPDEPDDLRLKLGSREGTVSWKSLSNVFDSARELGLNTALVGWSHPYGRVLNRSLSKCYWTAEWLSPGVEEPSAPMPLLESMSERVGLQFLALPFAARLPGVYSQAYNARDKLQRFTFLDDRAREIVADPSIGLALLHLPVPHPPAIYDRARGVFTAERKSYLDNVALADREFGVLRQAMEQAGLWDSTAILVSADHGWRTALWRGPSYWTPEDESVSHQETMGVPFLVKLPGRASPSTYIKPFNTIVTRRLITGILKGRITDDEGVAAEIETGTSDPPPRKQTAQDAR